MKKTLLGLLLCLPLAVGAQSIDSKVEQMGRMQYVKVSSLKSVVRDGLMRLQMELYNDKHNQQVVYWRVRWLDADGFQVGGDEAWKQELLHGQQRRTLQTVAPSRSAADFKIELQSPDNDAYGSASPDNE